MNFKIHICIFCLFIVGCVDNKSNERPKEETDSLTEFFLKKENYEIKDIAIVFSNDDILFCKDSLSIEKIRKEMVMNSADNCNFEMCDFGFPDSDFVVRHYCISERRHAIRFSTNPLDGKGIISDDFFFCEETKGNLDELIPLFKKAVKKKLLITDKEERMMTIDSLEALNHVSIINNDSPSIHYLEITE